MRGMSLRTWWVVVPLVAVAAGGLALARPPAGGPPSTATPDAAELHRLGARLAPGGPTPGVGKLPDGERGALALIVRAAAELDAVYLRQVWAGNPTLLGELARDPTPLGRERLHAFMQNKGPWLRLDSDRALLPGIGEKPEAANFYPPDATKA